MKITMLKLFIIPVGLLIIFLSACAGGGSQKKAESINAGLTLFKTNCAACHQENGEGIAQLYPPLQGSDLLKASPNRIACIIHNGLNGNIVVNGINYNQAMPGLVGLTPIEVADISNYVLNNFNHLDTYFDAEAVSKQWALCK